MADTTAFELGSGQLHNFKLTLSFDAKGKISDIADFKRKLVSTLKMPITLADLDLGKKQQAVSAVKVFVTFDANGKPTNAVFRKQFAKGTPVEYVARDVKGEVHLVGTPTLTPTQENTLFLELAREIYTASPFDTLPSGAQIHEEVRRLAPELKLSKKK